LTDLRGDTSRRPRVDPGLAGGLREWLEDGISGPATTLSGGARPVLVTGTRLTAALDGVSVRQVTWSVRTARDALVRILFRQQVSTGAIGDPVADALGAARAEGRRSLVDFIEGLARPARTVFDHEVATRAALLRNRWRVPAGAWLARTADRLSIPLAGGRVLLCAEADLVLGAPSRAHASICLVDVRGGPGGAAARVGRHYLALLETIRSGAPPARLATYHAASGRLETEDVTDALLAQAAINTIASVCALIAPTAPAKVAPVGQEATRAR